MLGRAFPRLMETHETVDCLIVGGGPAGLTAAIYCARFLLSTVVVDAGGGRARSIPRTHNHAGFPGGISGKDLLARIARQAEDNGARLLNATIETIVRAGDVFEARAGGACVRARAVIVATGISDRKPAIDQTLHDAALAASLIRYCPICDGFEVVDQRIAVIGSEEHGAREASFLRSYTRDVTLVAPDGPHQLSDASRADLGAQGISIVDGPIGDFAIEGRTLGFSAAAGRLRFDAVYPALGAEIHSELARSLGAAAREGGCLLVDDHARTTVPGVYAAGDVVLGLDQISGAMGQAALAATTIRNDLARDARRMR